MVVDPEQRGLLPLACTLGPDEGAARLAEWSRLWEVAGLGRHQDPGQLVLRFRAAAGVEAALGRLVEAERGCCAFLGWELQRDEDGWSLRISGEDDALSSLPLATGDAGRGRSTR